MSTLFTVAVKNVRYWRWAIGNLHKRFSHHSHPFYAIIQTCSSTRILASSKKSCFASYQANGSPLLFICPPQLNYIPNRKYSTFHPLLSMRQSVFIDRTIFHQHGNKVSSWSGDDCDSKEITQELVTDILRATRQTDIMTDSLSEQAVINLVSELQYQGFSNKNIWKLLSGRLWLLNQPDITLHLTELLLLHNFPYPMICRLIEAIPFSFHNSFDQLHDRINDTIIFFGSQGISGKDITSILSLRPDVLYLDMKTAATALSRLKSIFSSKDIKKLLKKSPGLLVDSWAKICQKHEYVVHSMVYTHHDIVQSSLFSHSLEHIKNRHLFLARSGLFVDVSPKLAPSLNPNPPLKSIVDLSDVDFLKLFPVTDIKRYQVFCEMRALEQEMEDEELDEYTDEDYIETDDSDSEGFIELPEQKSSSKKEHRNKSNSISKQKQR